MIRIASAVMAIALSGCATRPDPFPTVSEDHGPTGAHQVFVPIVRVVSMDADKEYEFEIQTPAGPVTAGFIGEVYLEYIIPAGTGVTFHQSPDLKNWVPMEPLEDVTFEVYQDGRERRRALFTALDSPDTGSRSAQFFVLTTNSQ